MYEKPFYKSAIIETNYTFIMEKAFNSILSKVPDDKRLTVHQIKFSLLSLKNLDQSNVTLESIVNYL